MARSFPPDRFARLIDVATRTFVARGYRLTQMSDVAQALGVAKGTLYGYVESKEALFDAALRYADGQVELPEPRQLPVTTPPSGSTVRYVRKRLMGEARELELAATLSRPTGKRARLAELDVIVRDLYRRMAKNHRALKLVDRCAVDRPDLAAVWFDEGRMAQVSLLASYIQRCIAEGRMRSVPNVPLAARMVLETIALWAIHMPWDPSPDPFPESEVENAVVDMVVHAYAKESTR